MAKRKVLFICKDNSSRSQMAAAFLNACFGNCYEAYSAGAECKPISPYAIKAMSEIGIDISKNCPKSIKDFEKMKFDCVVTLCDYAKGACRLLPGCKKVMHKGFKDPCEFKGSEKETIDFFRKIREEVFEWLEKEAVF